MKHDTLHSLRQQKFDKAVLICNMIIYIIPTFQEKAMIPLFHNVGRVNFSMCKHILKQGRSKALCGEHVMVWEKIRKTSAQQRVNVLKF